MVLCVERYSNNLGDAKRVGIKKGVVTGFSTGFMYFSMYGMYGLTFWYGTNEVLKGNIKVGDMITTFFNILLAAFGIGSVGYTIYVMSVCKNNLIKQLTDNSRSKQIVLYKCEGAFLY